MSWVPFGQSFNSWVSFSFSGKLRILIYLLPDFQHYGESQKDVIDMKEFCQPENAIKKWEALVGEAGEILVELNQILSFSET